MQDGGTKQRLLLVDGDPKSLRVLEVSLKKAGFVVATAANGVAALSALGEAVPGLIISDTHMAQMDGFELCRRIKERPEWTAIPFIFLSSGTSVEEKIRGLELGVEDYLTKPIYIKELITRVRMVLQRLERERLGSPFESKTRFSGQLAEIGVVDLVQTIEVNRKSGIVHIINRGKRRGEIYFRDGKVIDAEAGKLSGEDAVFRLFSWSDGAFEVEFKTLRRKDVIKLSPPALLIEGMRRLDEWTHILETLPPLETVFEVDYQLLADRLAEIPDEVSGLLRLFDGRRTLMQVIEDSSFPDLEALAVIRKLRDDGFIGPSRGEAGGVQARRGDIAARLGSWLGTGAAASPRADQGVVDERPEADGTDDAWEPIPAADPVPEAQGQEQLPAQETGKPVLSAADILGAAPEEHETKPHAEIAVPVPAPFLEEDLFGGEMEEPDAGEKTAAGPLAALPDFPAAPDGGLASDDLFGEPLEVVDDAPALPAQDAQGGQGGMEPGAFPADDLSDEADATPARALSQEEQRRLLGRAPTLSGVEPGLPPQGGVEQPGLPPEEIGAADENFFAQENVSADGLFSDLPGATTGGSAVLMRAADGEVVREPRPVLSGDAEGAPEGFPPEGDEAQTSATAPGHDNRADDPGASQINSQLSMPASRRGLKIVAVALGVALVAVAVFKLRLLPLGKSHVVATQVEPRKEVPREQVEAAPAAKPVPPPEPQPGVPGVAPPPQAALPVKPAAPAPVPVPAAEAAPAPETPAAAIPSAKSGGPGFELLKSACRRAYESRRYKDIISACTRALSANPNAADVMVMVAHAELDRGHARQAREWAEKALGADAALAEAYVFIGGAEQEVGHRREAREAYEKYLELAPRGQYANDIRAIVGGL